MSSHSGYAFKRSKYRLLGLVGQGQFGRVFCAIHRQTGQLVALKNLEQQRFPTHKFLRELRFLISLQHPNIVTCQALEHTPTGRYLVMDYCEGGTLRNLMQEDYRLNVNQSIKLIIDILAGLEHAHSRGIVHCDVKPENILLNLTPSGWTARISDFGIARLKQDFVDPRSQGNTGSPAYMAPERFYGQYSPASDIYSVGILLYELLGGDRPFSGTPSELMSAHLNRPLKFLSGIPQCWQPILSTALQKLAARRFHSAQEMLSAIHHVADSQPIETDQDKAPLFTSLASQIASVSWVGAQDNPQAAVALRQPIQTLATPFLGKPGVMPTTDQVMSKLCGSSKATVWVQNLLSSKEAPLLTTLPAPVEALEIRPQGYFAVTAGAVYYLTLDAASTGLVCQTVYKCDRHILAAFEPRGRWFTTVELFGDGAQSQLKVMPLPNSPSRMGLAHSVVPVAIAEAPRHSLRLFALDARHIALVQGIVTSDMSQTQHCQPKVEVFNRRGDRLGQLNLPVPIRQMVPTATPYRFIATDARHPQSVLMIDIKPLRITRIGLDIVPQFMTSTLWGYVIANSQGKIVLLDDTGQLVGRIEGPEHPTAIAPLPPHGLAVASWNGTQGKLHFLDLKELASDLLF